MRRRLLLLLLLLVAAAVLAWIAWPGGDDGDEPDVSGKGWQETGQDLLHGDGERPAAVPTLEGGGSDEVRTPVPGQLRDSGDESTVVRGTLVLVDARGRESTVSAGTLELDITDGGGCETAQVRVIQGCWSAIVPHGHGILPCEVEIDGRTAFFPECEELLSITPGRALALRARFPPPTVMSIVDAETGRDLGDVRLVRVRDFSGQARPHPGAYGPGCVVADGLASPIELPKGRVGRWDLMVEYYAHSPGYAWGRVVVNLRDGGDHVVSLWPGGNAEVEITGTSPVDDMFLRVRSAAAESRQPLAVFRLAGVHTVPIDGLPPGTYLLTAEVGGWWKRALRIAEVTCEVVAGKRTRAVLEIPEVTRPGLVPFAGEVVLPETWSLEGFKLTVTLLDAPLVAMRRTQRFWMEEAHKKVEGTSGTWPFDAGLVQPGRYQLAVSKTGYIASVVVGSSGVRGVRLKVPPPGHVSVQLLDPRTGKDAAIEEIRWHFQIPEGVTSVALQTVARSSGTRRFEFRAPLGRIQIHPDYDRYIGNDVAVQVVPGLTNVALTLSPMGSILVVLRGAGDRVPGWSGGDTEVLSIDGDGRVVATDERDAGVRVWVNKPGRYRVHLPPIPNFNPIPDHEVSVECGRLTKLVIRLERRQ